MNAITRIVAARPLSGPEPEEEVALWSGRPAWLSCALRIWKVRWVAIYFAVLLADGARLAMAGVHALPHAWGGEGKLAAIAALLLGGLLVMAALTVRTTRYTIQSRAVTLRYGMALRATLVIPFAAIEHVGVRIHRDGTGDVALRLKPGPGVIYPKLWPHARPWRLLRAEPMLRCVPDAGLAAGLLCRALSAAASVPVSTQSEIEQGVQPARMA